MVIEFVDPTMTGEYRLTIDPAEKDALAHVPGHQPDLTRSSFLPESRNQFTALETLANLNKPPAIKFKDLEAVISSRVTFNVLPIKVRTDFIRVTNSSVLTNITLQLENKDLQFQSKDGLQRATVNILGRLTTMTRRTANTFEHTVTVDTPAEFLKDQSTRSSLYQASVPLAPGNYRLNIVAKDVTSGSMAVYEVALIVPQFDTEKLSASSLILADQLERVPSNSIGAGQFVIGSSKVRPRVGAAFHRSEKLGVYLQVYNFTGKPNGAVEYEIVNQASGEKVFDFTEELSAIPGASASQVTIERILPLGTLLPGEYQLRLKVTDRNSSQVLSPATNFTIT